MPLALRLEADRRIADNWKLGVEGQAFLNGTRDRAPACILCNDDHYVRVKLTWFFGIE